jgi:hypothetical protein
MPELPQYFVTRPLERPQTAAPGPRSPEQPRINMGEATLAARALGGVGEAAGTFGQQLGKLAGALDRADDTLKYAEAIAHGLDALEATEAEVSQDTTISARKRHEDFKQRVDAKLGPLAQGLGPKAQAKFQLEMRPQVLARQRQLRVAGEKEFVEQARAGGDAVLATLQRQELATTDPVAVAAIQQSRVALITSFERERIIAPGSGAKLLSDSETAVNAARVDRMSRLKPQEMVEHLEARLRGEAGLPGMPDVAEDKVQETLDTSYEYLDKWLRRSEFQRQLSERERGERHDRNASTLRDRLYRPNVSIREMAALGEEITAARASGDIDEADHKELISHIQQYTDMQEREARIERRERAADAREARREQREARMLAMQDDPEAVRAVLPHIFGNTLDTSKSGEDWARTPGIRHPDTMRMILNGYRDRQKSDHVSNTPEYKRAVDFGNSQILGPASEFALLDKSDAIELQDLAKRRRENAGLFEAALYQTAVEMSGKDGVNTQTFRENWERVAREMVGRYVTEGEPPRPRVGFDTKEAIIDAYARGQRKEPGGITKEQAERDLLLLDVYTRWKNRTTTGTTPPAPVGGKK